MKKIVGQLTCVMVLSVFAWAAPQDVKVEKAIEKAQINQKIAAEAVAKTQASVNVAIGKVAADISGMVLDKVSTRIDAAVLANMEAKLATLGWEQDDRAREQAERAREQAERGREQAERAREQAERIREQSDSLYEQAYRSLDDGRWDRAAALFERVARSEERRVGKECRL